MTAIKSTGPRAVLLAALLAGLTWSGAASPALAQSGEEPVPHDLTAEDLEPFMDGLVSAQMSALHVPGVQVAVVRDREIIFARGYGYANLEERIPVDPDNSLFRPGSTTKLLVWTAVMQLVEAGKLDLNEDINNYLDDVQIPEAYGAPITMLNLMSHTPGFEDQGRNLFVAAPEDLQSLGEYLNANMPARVYPPGDLSSYSNYGVTLAGYIIEKVSGEDFYDYMDAHILQPLEMEHSTFRQPLPGDLAPLMAVGYTFSGQYTAGEFELVQGTPAGSMSASATDMAKFMIAQLEGGSYRGHSILTPETVAEMQAQHYTADPDFPGWAHGFMEEQQNGLRIIKHGGDTIQFHTLMMLIPEKHVGLYISYNSTGGAKGRNTVQRAFMDRYFPVEPAPILEPPDDFAERITDYTGYYRIARANYTTLEKVAWLGQQIPVRPGPDGLSLTMPSIGESGVMDTFIEVRPGVVQSTRDASLVYFTRQADSGPYEQVHPTSIQGIVGLRSQWYEALPFNAIILVGGLLMTLTAVFVAPAGLFGPRRPAPESEATPWPRRAARWTAFAWGLLTLTYVVVVAIFVLNAQTNVALLNAGPGPVYNVIWLTPLLAAAMAVFSVLAWRRRFWSVPGRVHYTLITLAALGLVWFGVFWNLMKW